MPKSFRKWHQTRKRFPLFFRGNLEKYPEWQIKFGTGMKMGQRSCSHFEIRWNWSHVTF